MRNLSSAQLLVVSAILGGLVGALATPVWCFGVESAAFVAGLIPEFPVDNSSALYHASIYSFWLVQLPALLIKLGMTPWAVTVFQSAFESALGWLVVSSTILVFTRFAPAVLLAPLMLFVFPMMEGHNYTVYMPVSRHVYGVAGMFGALLPSVLFALGMFRTGAFALGTLPALHPSLAIFGWLLGAVVLWRRKDAWLPRWKGLAVAFGVAFFFFAVSVAWQWLFIRVRHQGVAMEEAGRIAHAFALHWNSHLLPVGLGALWIDLAVIALFAFLLKVQRGRLSGGAAALLEGILAGTAAAAVFTVLYGHVIPVESFPLLLRGLIIPRWLNINYVVFPAVVLGLCFAGAMDEGKRGFAWLLIFLMAWTVLFRFDRHVATLLPPLAFLADFRSGTSHLPSPFYAYPLAALLFIAAHLPGRARRSADRARPPMGIFAAIVGLLLSAPYVKSAAEGRVLGNDDMEPLVVKVREGKGWVLLDRPSGDFLLPRARRMVLAPPCDSINYSSAGAPDMERRATRIYGVSILDPDGRVKLAMGLKPLFEGRDERQWMALAAEFGFGDILVTKQMTLRLPLVAESQEYRLYRVPESR